ncbi:MAG: hypothetical protein DWQ01_09175 [Planctomycetota bacterium]|nr:MAG: hypothetical protein DWQ01_09175 [Planctomycetota bacterium]
MSEQQMVEDVFVREFVHHSKKRRVQEALRNKKGREKFRAKLFHFSDFDKRWMQMIEPAKQNSKDVLELLKMNGAGSSCHLISAWTNLDGACWDLKQTLNTIIGYYPGTIVICSPSNLAYFEGEMKCDRYILLKRKGKF